MMAMIFLCKIVMVCGICCTYYYQLTNEDPMIVRHLQFSVLLALLIISASITQAAVTSNNSDLLYEKTREWRIPAKPIDMVQSLDGKFTFILTDKNQILIYEANGRPLGSIPVEKGVTGIDTDPRGEQLFLINSEKNTFTSVSVDFKVDIDITGSPVKGNINAPVTIVVFSDFECPYCRQAEPLINQVFEKNKNNVKLVFKNMPLRFHKLADPSARASIAAENQGKFWEFHDALFAVPQLTEQSIINVATQLGLNIDTFKKDMDSPEVRAKINKDLRDAQAAGVTGTPTIFINGKKLKTRSLQGFQDMIDQELKTKN